MRARGLEELERIRSAVEASAAAAYHWSIATDRLAWSSNAAFLLGVAEPADIASGRAFAALLDNENIAGRYETVMMASAADTGEGVAFSIEYLLRPLGRGHASAVWIEDCGRWYGGADGRPAEVFGLVRRIDERHAQEQHLRFLGNCDPLTGMMNRGRLGEALEEMMASAQATGGQCAFLIADIANLGVMNDAYGFDIADEVIVAVGRRLREVMRAEDGIGRYSGSKFGLMLVNCREEELETAAERFLAAARERVIETERGPLWATLSIGGITLPEHAGNANAAMARAEEALAEAKRQPSDAFVAFRPSPERVSIRGLNARCATEIVSGLRNDRFALAYQPIVSAATGQTVMHEGLLRLQGEDGQLVAAMHLIPVAEKLGLVRLIDRQVMGLALDVVRRHPSASLSVNVSGITATDPRWFTQLTDMLAESRDLTPRIMVEITETAALNDLDDPMRFIATLRELGCRVAIDDFGAGYTSFRNLKVLDVDMVKIDGSFCERLSESVENQYFVRSLIDLARKFDLETIAEWVQSEADAELLRAWGVDYLQGHLFGAASLTLPWKAVEPEAGPPVPVAATAAVAPPASGPSRLRTAIALLDEAFLKRG